MNNNLEHDVEAIKSSIKLWGTDDKTIIEISLKRSYQERLEIADLYRQKYNTSIYSDFETGVGGNLGKILISYYLTEVEFLCQEINKAILNKDYYSLIEIIGSRNSNELVELMLEYQYKYNITIIENIKNLENKQLKDLLVKLLQNKRNSIHNELNQDLLNNDVDLLIISRKDILNREEIAFEKIFSLKNPKELNYINFKFIEKSGKTLFNIIDEDFQEDVSNALRFILLSQINPTQFYYERLIFYLSTSQFNLDCITRIVILRKNIDLVKINEMYYESTHKTIYEVIKSNCEDIDYREFLLDMLYFLIKLPDINLID